MAYNQYPHNPFTSSHLKYELAQLAGDDAAHLARFPLERALLLRRPWERASRSPESPRGFALLLLVVCAVSWKVV